MKRLIPKGNWLVTLPIAGLSLAYLSLFFLPTQKEISRLRNELRGKEAALKQSDPIRASIEETEEAKAVAALHVEAWTANHKLDTGTVLADVSDQARRAEFRNIRLDPERTVQYRSIRRTPLVLGTTGSFRQTFELLRNIEGMQPEVWVDHLRIKTGPDSGSPLSSEVTLGIFTVKSDNSDYVERSD